MLTAQGVAEPAPLCAALLRFKEEYKRRQVGPQGRIALDWLMPELLRLVVASEQPARLFERVCELLTRIFTRSAYLQLLAENPGALRQLVRLCDASHLVSEQLARYPILLDELLDPQHLYHPTPLDQYKPQLRQFLLRIPEEDVEQQMEALRQFKQVQLLRIVAADIAGALPLMKVSDHLTWLAEAITEEVVNQAWAQMSERYGCRPMWQPAASAALRWWPMASWAVSSSVTARISIWCSCTAATPTATPTGASPSTAASSICASPSGSCTCSAPVPVRDPLRDRYAAAPLRRLRPAGLVAVGL